MLGWTKLMLDENKLLFKGFNSGNEMIGQGKSWSVTCSDNVNQLYGHGLKSSCLNKHHLTSRTVTE